MPTNVVESALSAYALPVWTTLTPAGGDMQSITIPFAGAVTLRSLLSGADFPYYSEANGAKIYPNAFAIWLTDASTTTCRMRDGGVNPTTSLGFKIPVEPGSLYFHTRHPIKQTAVGTTVQDAWRVIATTSNQPAIVKFYWNEGQ